MKKTSKLLALLLALCLCTGALSAAALTDVPEDSWFAGAVDYVQQNDIMEPASEDSFDPYGSITRGYLIETIYNMAGRPDAEGEPFDDVDPDASYADAVLWAKVSGLVVGQGDGFNGEKLITRAELANAFYNYMELNGITTAEADLTVFTDAAEIPEWAEAAMNVAVSAKIVAGKGDGILDPGGLTNRAELAQIHLNFSPLTLDTTSGTVAIVDRYGNITLSLLAQNLYNAGFELGDILTITIGELELDAPLCTSYSDVDTGSVVIRAPGGLGTRNIIIAINMGNFAETNTIAEGAEVTLALKEAGGYLNEWELRQLERTNVREDYDSDEIFANFRSVEVGEFADGVYFRSSSPIDPELGRAAYADDLCEAAGIMTVINLSNSEEEAEALFAAEGFDSPYYKSLYDNGNVICLAMGVDFSSDDFAAKLKLGLEFLLDNDGPFLVHCTEGKDRAGFVTGILAALMGATAEEIKTDYLESFVNYYKVEPNSEQYDRIGDSNILESMRGIAGLEKGADLTDVDLAAAAEDYLTGIGLDAAQITALREALSTSK